MLTDNPVTFSPCRKYRYTLFRETGAQNQKVCQFICLNPSTADETKNDPTVRRCINFAKSWGYGIFCMTNLFAWRDTDPREMKKQEYPIGEHNDLFIRSVHFVSSITIAAWGKDGVHMGRDKAIIALIPNLYSVGPILNNDRTPKHPLYLSASLKPVIYQP